MNGVNQFISRSYITFHPGYITFVKGFTEDSNGIVKDPYMEITGGYGLIAFVSDCILYWGQSEQKLDWLFSNTDSVKR